MSNARDPLAHYDVIVIGGGAAGLICAIEAGRRGRSVLVLEGNDSLGRKILISGGGRCNFTNLNAAPEHYLSDNPDFCKSALSRYTPRDFIDLIERYGIAYHEKKLGQLFCDGSARQIVDLLQRECDGAGVQVRLGCHVEAVDRAATFALATDRGGFECESLVVATGGLSFPNLGATDLGYLLARQFGHGIIDPRPGLVPLSFGEPERRFCFELSGVAVDVIASSGGPSFRENMLLTHQGLSGPAVLQASSYWRAGGVLSLDLLPEGSALELLSGAAGGGRELAAVLSDHMPRRFAQAWCALYAPSRSMRGYTKSQIEAIARLLQCWQVYPSGTAGYGKAEVTAGGVDTTGLSSRTMESRRVSGLFFVGEVVDVTGWLGGYNFQWAWASGWAAGQYA